MPIHGEYRMLEAHARLAEDAGVPASSVVIADNGAILELSSERLRMVGQIDAGVTSSTA